ncbi:MAG TPA: MTH938/NDUFAF3 family protein [Steroidobacteraceae bacterium]|jgi:uncharacterized protein
MRFTQDSSSTLYLIRGYGAGEIIINDQGYRGAVLVSGNVLKHEPDVVTLEALLKVDPDSVLALDPELVLLGTGARQEFPHPQYGAKYLKAGVGFEVMDTGAACRTYNVLIAEQRRAAALLLA